MGTGSGIQAETLLNQGIKKENILCSDIDKEAVRRVKSRGFKTIGSDVFSKIKGKFDLISFNPPYLPEDTQDKEKDTTGGKLGDETILAFLQQAKNHLKKEGKIFLLFSSLTPQKRIIKEIKKQKFKILAFKEKNLFFERLFVFIFSL